MGFEATEAFRFDPGGPVGGPDDGGLAFGARGGKARFVVAVVVDGRAEDDRPDMIPVGQGFFQGFKNDYAGPVAEDRPFRLGVERPAVAVGRNHQAVLVKVAALPGEHDRGPAGQGHFAASFEHGLACQVNGDERRRAGGQNRVARALEVELVGNAGGDIVPIVEKEGVQIIGGQEGCGLEAADPFGVVAGPEEDADRPARRARRVSGVFEGLPGAFVEQADLGIHLDGFPGRIGEKLRVEGVDIFHDALGFDIAAVAHRLAADARLKELFVRESGDGFAAGLEVVPELLDIPGSGEASGHSDDGDGLGEMGAHNESLRKNSVSPSVVSRMTGDGAASRPEQMAAR